ncbi:hypothetical protein MTR67_016388 [Solanum verrucosum]|uniref:NB-ARC domain-containing protein n=1 Tax=Solanum verrucosum TaxID=315347 RepID=A0AAF0TQR3_SOLVR|nr:hypothetical protein MTR67_016388 [Solanum verrucosum]
MLIACFPKIERGNRTILTSRISKVGSQVKCRTDPHHLQVLTPEKSWDLFEKRVFGKGSCPDELSDIGHQIVEKCRGLPLTVVLIAGVIVRVRKGKEKEKGLWLKIQHNLDSFISANINLQMMKVMQLSYDHLPYHLKPLLLYFARSRKSKRTPVSKLMQLWMAEGLVDHDIPSKSSLDEATQSYLDTLISSSLIMVDHIKKSESFSVTIKVCYVHDVVHDFCSEKTKNEKFFKLINSGARFHDSDFLHRRLTIHSANGQLNKRCVLFNSKKYSVGSKHLISLKVSGLLLSSRILKLSKLKHVKIDMSSLEEKDKDWDNIMHQPNRLLEAENSKLEHLKTLSKVDISYTGATSNVLEKFPNLQHLDCIIKEPIDPPTHRDWFPKFDVLNKLESIIAIYENSGYPDKMRQPNEYYFPNSLKELRLSGFSLRPDLLSAIAALPQLEIMEFVSCNFVEDKWDASEHIYQRLKTLSMRVVNHSEWEVDAETFPKLEELILEHCYKLREIPCAFMDIHTLKSIHLINIRRELGDSAIEIKKQVVDYAGEGRLQVHIEDVYE